jgi:hypothetical protein
MTVKQIQLADRWLQMWARKVYPGAQQRESDGPLILVDLDSAAPPTLSLAAPGNAGGSIRYAYAGRLATSIRGRLKRLQTGANPAELQLGHDCSVEQCTMLLSYLDRCWCQPPRHPSGGPPVSLQLCTGGLDGAFYRIGGRTFQRSNVKKSRGALHFASLDALSDYDRGKEEAERLWVWERWDGAYEWREASLVRTDATLYRWRLEQLVIVSDGERERAGYVTRLACDDQGGLAITLRLWTGTARALTARPASKALSDEPPLPALLLSETPDDRPCLIVASRTFHPNLVLRAADGGPERRFRVSRWLLRVDRWERGGVE